ncbi:hypothetical protein B0H19DRAFT_1213638 [Mycena capillaripes]|nr:hypothetical protein B0H19DRAFT_1213638 [Mycena capillaripes]
MAIATNDIPRVNALLSSAIRNGASLNTIIVQILEAVQGLRSTKGFTDFEHDLSLLIYRVGGQSLLYSLNHALGLPSLRTIGNSAHFVKITPTLGPVSIQEIRENIKKVILEPRALAGKTEKRGGVVFMMDEVAIEEHFDYFPNENKVGGLCQKHSGTAPLTLQTYKSALTIVDKLPEGEVHFGKEMAVVAVRFGDAKNIYPILAYPTCKQETVEDMEKVYTLLMQAWEELGATTYGDIRNFATDGDPLASSCEELPKDLALYRILSNLHGLNLCTGPKVTLQTFDWRHIIKRGFQFIRTIICSQFTGDGTLVRQPSGMYVDAGRVVDPHFWGQCLQLLADYNQKSVDKLMNPDDPQDVSRAIELVEAIVFVNVDLTAATDSVRLLDHVFENFTFPFITPEFSLSKQIRMLSTCAHLLFILLREYRTDFMSNQLYGDTQSSPNSSSRTPLLP